MGGIGRVPFGGIAWSNESHAPDDAPSLVRPQAANAEAERMKKAPKLLGSLGAWFIGGQRRTVVWWSWGESNPRPKAIAGQIYTLS